jgi:hypothetical protein
MKLRKLCIYDKDEWIDVLRVYVIGCDGMLLYVLHHIEDEDMYVYYNVKELLEAARRRVAMDEPRLGPCP